MHTSSTQITPETIQAYLQQHEQKDLLRFITCGSVDDGKSTLIGRLLHDSKMIYEDQLAAVTADSKKVGTTGEAPDLALLVDGLQSEREQGITIDVAYRYFSTDKRKFIIADTPGHEQYTRNMATGASTAQLAILLIDARYGVQTQTRRHSFICSLLGIKHFVIAINKMDLVDYSEQTFAQIKTDYLTFAQDLGVQDIQFVPISALAGDNVVHPSAHMPWYQGNTLMSWLEEVEIAKDINYDAVRFPVQYVNRPHLNFRGYCGTLASGSLNVGQKIKVLPSGKTSTIKSIITYEGELETAYAGQAITLTLNDEIDISRGDLILAAEQDTHLSQHLQAHLVWMHETPLQIGKQYHIKLGTQFTSAYVTHIDYQVDINTLAKEASDHLSLNGIALCRLELTMPVAFDTYEACPHTGSFILIDRLSNLTLAAGMITQNLDKLQEETSHSSFELELNALIRKHFPHWQAKDISQLIKS
ncbi:sulfate adenylyltransferase subunit 1 [Allopseudospirillum japonicum]|uniref:Sulfate adenylyltransferase subunit 1 n=1 Tax=Allopseudospirillum japonicum TaxID=64971 RepID=A0A1H6REN8_9GAMM|nr:sulfate adenylyltransferase subunit CysN [Allopseudospirillum japonicum]SEI54223.1 sulfate adenylyltransferase subunit 1 [Allopseudospirillum japonicum]